MGERSAVGKDGHSESSRGRGRRRRVDGKANAIVALDSKTLKLNYGTLYPALLKLEQEGFVRAAWGQSENNRRAKYYSLTAKGRKRLAQEAREWHRTADLIAAFLAPREEAP